ncbi:MAG: SelB C-terminal domain-containing protein [Candidatus Aminicenantes bacterium]|jgi:selenocysteine-specific elongation factor
MGHHKKENNIGFCDFDATLDSWPASLPKRIEGVLAIKGRQIPVFVSRYEEGGAKSLPGSHFVRIHADRYLKLCWNDKFKIFSRKNGSILFRGRVLLPCTEESKQKGIKRRLELLQGLSGDEKEMVLALTCSYGIKGLGERELVDFSSLSKEKLLSLSRLLEEEGKIRILSFSPLFLLSQDSIDFLSERVVAYLREFHEKHPEDFGVSPEKIQKRFGSPPRVLALALKHLSRTGIISKDERNIAMRDFYPLPSPEEEKLLQDMESMYLEGKLRSVSMGEIQKRLSLSIKKLNRLLSFLVERRKIVLGRDGFLLHSKWLDDVILAVRSSGKKELSVSDFKQMTGLTRKYAIPLLELLDELGVTRRKGPVREIIQDGDKKA